jgi:hypothetical protein
MADAAVTNTAVAGAWSVDTSIGELSCEDSTGTFVGFRVDEELSSIGSTTAVGHPHRDRHDHDRRHDAYGSHDRGRDDGDHDDDSCRDDEVQSALGTSQYPTATFTLTEPIDLGDVVSTGATNDGRGDR